MKRWNVLLSVFLAGCFVAAAGVPTEDEIEDLKDKVKIGSVSDDTIEGDDDSKYEQLKFYTTQYEDSVEDYAFYMRVTVELTEKKSKDSYFAQFARTQGDVDTEYTGEDNWEFVVAHGDLQKPKITAFVVQYGILVDKDGKKDFIILAEEMDDVDSLDELTKRSPNRLEQKPRILHQYSYRDNGGDGQEVIQSMWK